MVMGTLKEYVDSDFHFASTLGMTSATFTVRACKEAKVYLEQYSEDANLSKYMLILGKDDNQMSAIVDRTSGAILTEQSTPSILACSYSRYGMDGCLFVYFWRFNSLL